MWARIGFEFVRSPFDWRLDGGEWKTVSPDELTTDLMELGFWTEIAWLKLGNALAAGPHTLSVRLPKTKEPRANRSGSCSPSTRVPDRRRVPSLPVLQARRGPSDGPRPRGGQKRVPACPAGPTRRGADRSSWRPVGSLPPRRADCPAKSPRPSRTFRPRPAGRPSKCPATRTQRDDLVFAHRLWYRTRVNVPASLAGRSSSSSSRPNNLNTTVYVNGQFCGFDKNPFARVQIDVTKAVKPGVNEFWVGIKDAWYGYQADPKDPLKLRRRWNLPLKFFSDGFQELVYPVWNQTQTGILGTPELVAAGPVYAADVFCKPSVADKELGLEVTLAEQPPGARDAGDLWSRRSNDKTGQVESTGRRGRSTCSGSADACSTSLDWPEPETLVARRAELLPSAHHGAGRRPGRWTCRRRCSVSASGRSDGIHLQLNGITWQGFSEHGSRATRRGASGSLKDPKYNTASAACGRSTAARYKWLGQEPERSP